MNDIISIFMISHTVFKVDIFQSTYKKDLDCFVDGIKKLSTYPGVQKSNNNGYQSKDLLHSEQFMKPLLKWICTESNTAFNAIGNPKEFVNIESCWFNINNDLNSHNQIHLHSGILSGVFYLQAPEGSGNLNLINSGMNQLWQGHLEARERNANNAYHFTIKPKAGDLFLWPSYLYHSVDTNSREVERISISFNLS